MIGVVKLLANKMRTKRKKDDAAINSMNDAIASNIYNFDKLTLMSLDNDTKRQVNYYLEVVVRWLGL